MWVVDTCVVLDVLENDPKFGLPSAKLLQQLLRDGLTVAPVTMVELAAAFRGDLIEQKRFLQAAGIVHSDAWTIADTEEAQRAWNDYVAVRRENRGAKRPIADILIGSFAANRQGLVTRNPSNFRRWFPRMTLREP